MTAPHGQRSIPVNGIFGALTTNEIRELENRNPYPDGVGDQPTVNGAYTLLGDVGKPPPPAPTAPDPKPIDPAADPAPKPTQEADRTTAPSFESRHQLEADYGTKLADSLAEIAAADVEAIRSGTMNHLELEDFQQWFQTYTPDLLPVPLAC